MKWFKRKNKSRSAISQDYAPTQNLATYGTPPVSSQLLVKLPAPLLERIFSFVCPHAQDETYEGCEQSYVADSCMLCDLRDISHCAQVSKRWRTLAYNVMYHSIRIDAVHYCALEDVLAEKRKRRSFLVRNAEPEDTPKARLHLLCRTLRDDQKIAGRVQFLKTPYMARETCKADLARIVAVLGNLKYVDLPEGIFMDDPSCNTLKQEVQVRCPDLRKMSYMKGSERSLELLASGNLWRNLEVLELSHLNMDPMILRGALGSLRNLRALKVSDMASFNDEIFHHSDYIAPFPALDELIFEKTPNITGEGLAAYLFRSDTQDSLKTLCLTETGVHPSALVQILAVTHKLKKLSIVESVSTSFPPNIEPLQSRSLRIMHYEISNSQSQNSYARTAASYYAHLTRSVVAGGLPGLRQLYVRDPDFPESLIDLAPPMAPYASDPDNFTPPSFGSPPRAAPNRFSSNNPFANMPSGPGLRQELEVYSKGLDEMEWNFSKVQPPKGHGRRGSATTPRPVSSYGLSENLNNGWGQVGGARRSVIVGNGFGGFLAVPADNDGRPSTSGSGSGHRRRGSQYDMWR